MGALFCDFTYGNWFQALQIGVYSDCAQICTGLPNPVNGQPGTFATPQSTDIPGLLSILPICFLADIYSTVAWAGGPITTGIDSIASCLFVSKQPFPNFASTSGYTPCSRTFQCLCAWPSTRLTTVSVTVTQTATVSTQSIISSRSVTVSTTGTLTRSDVSLELSTVVVSTTTLTVSTSRTTRTISSSTLIASSLTTTLSTTTTLEVTSTTLYTSTLSTLILTTVSSLTTSTSTLVTCPA